MWLTGAASARADDVYSISTCRAPDGKPAPTAGWMSGGDAPITKVDNCAKGGALTAGPSTAEAGRSKVTWTFTAPAATRIAGYSLYRTVRPVTGSGWSWNWSLFRNIDDETAGSYIERCWGFSGCTGLGDGSVSDASRVSEGGVDLGAIVAFGDCNPTPARRAALRS